MTNEQSGEASICGATAKSTGEPCKRPAGWGVDGTSSGRCKFHGGASPGGQEGNDGGAPEDNTNSVSHGLFAEKNHFYQEVMDDDLRTLCDNIYEDYIDKFTGVNGAPITGEKSRLFEIAVNHIKIIYSDNWAVDRPDELESGNPMVDREESYKTAGDSVVMEETYRESVTVATQQKLRREDRSWLRDYNLLDDPESAKADALGELNVTIERTRVTEENVDQFTE